MTEAGKNLAFGKKRQQHVLILASGEKIRHITIRPWLVLSTLLVLTLVTAGYLGATAYLMLKDDMLGAMIARQTRMQKEYEDRITALRSQVDRVTSRQLLEQQAVERKVEKLLAQQSELKSRHGRMSGLLDDQESPAATESSDETAPVNAYAPQKRADLSKGSMAIDQMLRPSSATPDLKGTLAYQNVREPVAGRALSRMLASLDRVESDQMSRIASLTVGARNKADAMADIIRSTGLKIDEAATDAIGGPFAEPVNASGIPFEASIENLDNALDRLESVRGAAEKLPLGNPAPGRDITSRFGNRMDPFLGRLALHTGIDFRAETGADVRTTGSGKVIFAGVSGGYGNMVEIDHGQGVTTRYGHLSRILVHEGETLDLGDIVGKAGSTGRSTGPHVHYEVRLKDEPVDPMRFLVAGTELKSYLQ